MFFVGNFNFDFKLTYLFFEVTIYISDILDFSLYLNFENLFFATYNCDFKFALNPLINVSVFAD